MDVSGISVERAQEIEDASIVEGEVNGSGHLVLTNHGGTEFNAGLVIRSPQIDVFTSNGGWTKPEGAVLVRFMCIGGGGGGAGGGGTGQDTTGGGGGGGGFNEALVDAEGLPDTEMSVVVGSGGDGADGTGENGSPGGGTYVAGVCGALGGAGGYYLADDPRGGAAGNLFAGDGSVGVTDIGVPSAPTPALRGGGGGGGGRLAGEPAAALGGPGGSSGGVGLAVNAAGDDLLVAGAGGAGGRVQVGSPYVLPGEDGYLYGGGGGGGARCRSPELGSRGGDGAPGLCVIITYF